MTKKRIVIAGDKGLNLAVGSLADDPTALIAADNVVVEAPGVIKSRKGLARNTAQTNTIGRPIALFSVPEASQYLYMCGTSSLGEPGGILSTVTGSGHGVTGKTAFTSGQYFYPGAYVNNALYGTSTGGQVLRHDGAANIERTAGLTPPVFINQDTLTQLNTNANSWMNDNEAVAYRIVFKYTNSAGRVYLSPPSQRLVIRKQAATTGFTIAVAQSPVLTWMLPTLGKVPTAGTEGVFQIYRSRKFVLTATVTEPDDELQLVYESAFTSAAYLGAQVYTFTDNTPDEALGLFDAPFLYTNPQTGEVSAYGQGLINANNMPPHGSVECVWRDSLWVSNPSLPSVQDIQLLTISGVVVGNSLTITTTSGPRTIVPIAVAGAPATALQWKIYNTGTVSFNLEKTANNICAAINLSAQVVGNDYFVYAEYIAQYGGVPGYIRITRSGTDPIAAPFTVSGSTPTFSGKFSPILGTNAYSNVDLANGLAFSKPGEYEAFPFIQRLAIGQANVTILKAVPFRSSLFVFTTRGVYRITGTSAYDYSVERFQDTFVLFNSRSACICDDAVYAWGTNGILKLTESGTEFIHLPIQPLHLQASNYMIPDASGPTSNFACFLVAHQAKHKVYFFYTLDSTTDVDGEDAGCERAIVYDTISNAFTTLSFNTGASTSFRVFCGTECVASGKLFLSEGGVGTGFRYIRSLRYGEVDADFKDTLADNTDAANPLTVTFVAAVGDPSETKLWRELQVYWNNDPVFSALGKPTAASSLVFKSDTGVSASTTLPTNATTVLSRQTVPQGVTRSTRMQVTLSHNAIEYVGIEGVALVYESGSTRVTRGTEGGF